ncbi:hypothetical protein MAR_004219 [Mya arenaria]|uniref:Uncharacterized protein n=1 Tax=Mya arenaria TaxID=6604 RepID=A0ABY7EYE6_MYAAR|nr:hypothetical protein MAR_004219 [Mya arenaria]
MEMLRAALLIVVYVGTLKDVAMVNRSVYTRTNAKRVAVVLWLIARQQKQ